MKAGDPLFRLTIRSSERPRSNRVHRRRLQGRCSRVEGGAEERDPRCRAAQVVSAEAALKTAQDTYQKTATAYEMNLAR